MTVPWFAIDGVGSLAGRSMRALLVLGLILAGAACRFGRADAPTAEGPVPPLVLPVAYRFETVLFDVPLARAEELLWPAQSDDATLGCRIDDKGNLEKLEALAKSDGAIVRSARADLVLAPGVAGRIAGRKGDLLHPSASLAADGLGIDARALYSYEWQAYDLYLELEWFPDGGARVRFPCSTPMPKDLRLEIDALPPRSGAGNAKRAVIGFVRAVPVLP